MLSHNELLQLIDSGVIRNALPENVNGTTIDVRLGPDFLFEKAKRATSLTSINLDNRESLSLEKKSFKMGGMPFLDPGEFVLAHTIETFDIPLDLSAIFILKSSMARSGLNQLTAQFCQPGWRGSSLTLELINSTRFHRLEFTVGMEIGQMIFFRHDAVPDHANQMRRTKGHINDTITKAHHATDRPTTQDKAA